MAGIFASSGLFYKAGESSSGGDQHNLGWYATQSALETAHPTAEDGDWAIVGSTDTVWVWDGDTNAWKDTDQKGQVTSVNGQTGEVTVQATLVNQSNIKSVNGNSLLGSGNLELSTFLPYPAGWTTNGTTKAFCDDIAADTTAIGGKAYLGEVTLSDLPASMSNAEIVVEIMAGTTAQNKVIVLTCTSGNTAPYMWKYTYWNNGTDVSGWKGFQEQLVSGTNIKTINNNSILGSGNVELEQIQRASLPTASANELGNIYQFVGTTDANYTNGYFYKCVSDGALTPTYSWTRVDVQPSSEPVVPSTMPTLAVADWSSNTQTVNVTGVTASNIVFVSPAPASASDYASAGIICTAQGTDSLTFTCTTVPANAITVNVVIMG